VSFGRWLLYLLTALALFMAGSGVYLDPPPLWVPLLFGLFYLAVIGWGVMSPALSMFGDSLCQVTGARGQVALTFDDGPDPYSTREALRILREENARATFFVVGKKAAKYPEILREIVEQGHALGVHSYGHERLYSLLPPERVRQDIERVRAIIVEATGHDTVWFRPPIGQMSPRTAEGVERAGVSTIGWSVRSFDGVRRTTDAQCLRRVTAGLKEGAIVLLHDAWEFGLVSPAGGISGCPAGVRVLARIIQECRARGLQPVTVEELVESAAD
jgi:peptidoglycan-N-acetylglucosamine deacetylase